MTCHAAPLRLSNGRGHLAPGLVPGAFFHQSKVMRPADRQHHRHNVGQAVAPRQCLGPKPRPLDVQRVPTVEQMVSFPDGPTRQAPTCARPGRGPWPKGPDPTRPDFVGPDPTRLGPTRLGPRPSDLATRLCAREQKTEILVHLCFFGWSGSVWGLCHDEGKPIFAGKQCIVCSLYI